jgi:predicted solute-binding protein
MGYVTKTCLREIKGKKKKSEVLTLLSDGADFTGRTAMRYYVMIQYQFSKEKCTNLKL